jgi:hypothetical protein
VSGGVLEAMAPIADEIADEDGDEGAEPERDLLPSLGREEPKAMTLHQRRDQAEHECKHWRHGDDVEAEKQKIGAHLARGGARRVERVQAARGEGDGGEDEEAAAGDEKIGEGFFEHGEVNS